MQYVYRYYITGKGNISQRWLYVGIAKDLHRRVDQHKHDNLGANIRRMNYAIQYFPVRSRFDADALETYLIGLYRPVFNKAKKEMDEDNTPSFLGDAVNEIQWYDYEGKKDLLAEEPFTMHSFGYIYGQVKQAIAMEKFRKAMEAIGAKKYEYL